MQIEVIGTDDSSTAKARAYAEYRLFATLARHARVIRSVRVVLSHLERNGNAGQVTCAVNLVLEPCGSVRARAQEPHAHGAIDRAAERIGNLMDRRASQRPCARSEPSD
jgi:ribosome-associated translation inhibitor RaiA